MNIPPPPKVVVLLVILPEELIVEVLSFLGVKYLMRMKCVCKSWKALISADRVFIKMHLKKQSARMTHLALLSNTSDEGSEDCRAVPISRLLVTTSNSITLTDDNPLYRFRNKDAIRIVGSCNGLVCLRIFSYTAEYTEYLFRFWNPAIRIISETFVSPPISLKLRENIHNFSFGYDDSTETYKMVLLCLKEDGNLITTVVRIFTLGDCVWKDIDCFPVVLVCPLFCWVARDGVFFNNSINWLVRRQHNCHLKNITIEQLMIISLDLGTETYTELLLPRCCDVDLHDSTTLSVLNDCLCFSYTLKKTHYVIWKMKAFGIEESWTQFLKVSFFNLQLDYKSRELEIGYTPELIMYPLCLSENGDVVVFGMNIKDEAIVYNWRDNRVKRIKSTNEVLWFNAKGYVESLVSTS